MLGDPGFPLTPRKGEDADAMWLVPIDERRRVALPLQRLRDLMAPLLEWLQELPERDAEQGVLRLDASLPLPRLRSEATVWLQAREAA